MYMYMYIITSLLLQAQENVLKDLWTIKDL